MIKTEFDPVFKTLCDNLEGTPRQLSRQQKREKHVLFYKRFSGIDAQVFFDAMNAWISKSDFMPTALQMQDAVDYQESAKEPVIQPVPVRMYNEDGSRMSMREICKASDNPKALEMYDKYCCRGGKHKPIEAEEAK